MKATYIDNYIDSKVGDVPDHASLLRRNLGVLNQLCQILLADAVLRQDVEKDDPDFVVDGDILIQKNGNNVLHVVFDLLSLSIRAHGQILLHFTQLVNVALHSDEFDHFSIKLCCK